MSISEPTFEDKCKLVLTEAFYETPIFYDWLKEIIEQAKSNLVGARVSPDFGGRISNHYIIPKWGQNGQSGNFKLTKIIELENGKYFECRVNDCYKEVSKKYFDEIMQHWDEDYEKVYKGF